MATLNAYAVTPGKPMVYSLESARKFLASTKNPMYIRTDDGFVEVHGFSVTMFQKLDAWTSFEVWRHEGEGAVNALYKLRKAVNARFKD